MILAANIVSQTSVPTPGYWVHNLDPMLVHFPAGWPLDGLRWYGLAYVAGFIVAGILLNRYYKFGKSPIDPERQSILMTALVVGVLAGARLGYVFGYMLPRNPGILLEDPAVIFRVNEGGMASHGGMLGVWLALIWFSRKYKTPFWGLMDITATLAPAGFFFGRLANFVNSELWGRETTVPWGVIFRAHNGPVEMFLLPRHPSQLYEAALEGLLLLAWTQWRFWRSNLKQGRLFGEAISIYALVRIFGEIFREPDAGVSLVLGLSRGQFYSLFILLLGVAVIIRTRGRAPSPQAAQN
ncbi:MAG: prolipoprotein diacylglyceryl transferase [Puniceicoccales bacterium]|jgi:phosphatidylglycerol:prolipoprotein diacylglycerol transferase|nr:prolipoprotein diacylglyceryl transferase [Puniceicoccales bacterium]